MENLPVWYFSISTETELFLKIHVKTDLLFLTTVSVSSPWSFINDKEVNSSIQDSEATAGMIQIFHPHFCF